MNAGIIAPMRIKVILISGALLLPWSEQQKAQLWKQCQQWIEEKNMAPYWKDSICRCSCQHILTHYEAANYFQLSQRQQQKLHKEAARQCQEAIISRLSESLQGKWRLQQSYWWITFQSDGYYTTADGERGKWQVTLNTLLLNPIQPLTPQKHFTIIKISDSVLHLHNTVTSSFLELQKVQ